jgi:ferredoxin
MTAAALFDELKPPLLAEEARVEASRCLECGGAHAPAPCTVACPADVDVPGFVTAIADGDLGRAAELIFAENLLGGTCARVCPTELLCEGACVLVHEGRRPIEIGRLQRHAADAGLATASPRPAAVSRSSAPGRPAWPAPANSPPGDTPSPSSTSDRKWAASFATRSHRTASFASRFPAKPPSFALSARESSSAGTSAGPACRRLPPPTTPSC